MSRESNQWQATRKPRLEIWILAALFRYDRLSNGGVMKPNLGRLLSTIIIIGLTFLAQLPPAETPPDDGPELVLVLSEAALAERPI